MSQDIIWQARPTDLLAICFREKDRRNLCLLCPQLLTDISLLGSRSASIGQPDPGLESASALRPCLLPNGRTHDERVRNQHREGTA